MTRLLIRLALLMLPAWGYALESGSQVAWTQDTLKLVKSGDVERGKNLAESCKGCHGELGQGTPEAVVDGETIPAIPALAGQLPTYIFKQLRDYFNGDRSDDPVMTSTAQGLTEQQAADLAAWYAWLPGPKLKASNENLAVGEKLVKEGDGKRILPPCFVCHGAKGQGEKIDIPSLSGQQLDYLVQALMAYKKGDRHNDVYSRMRLIAKQLSDDEIKLVARYYQYLQ